MNFLTYRTEKRKKALNIRWSFKKNRLKFWSAVRWTSKLTGRNTHLTSHEFLHFGPRGQNVCDVAIECDHFSPFLQNLKRF